MKTETAEKPKRDRRDYYRAYHFRKRRERRVQRGFDPDTPYKTMLNLTDEQKHIIKKYLDKCRRVGVVVTRDEACRIHRFGSSNS